MKDRLVIKGARRHSLRDVSVELPRDVLIVFAGVSGAGKSSLAFDTISRRCSGAMPNRSPRTPANSSGTTRELEGAPEKVAACSESYTGQFLRRVVGSGA